jgi:hypothetical protein
MTTLDYQITGSTYDCDENDDTTLNINGHDSDGDRIGNRTAVIADIEVIFVAVAVPKYSTITTAYIQGYHNFNGGGNPSVIIKGYDENSPAEFTSTTRPSQRAKLGTTVSQTCPAGVGTFVSFAEIKTIVQAIIDRAGWATGQNMGFSIEDNGSAVDFRSQFGDYFYDSTKAWKLHIEYVARRRLALLGVG